MNNGWKWTVDKMEEVRDAMTPADRETFMFDLEQLHWPTYIGTAAHGPARHLPALPRTCRVVCSATEQGLIGCKKYLMKEDMGRVNVALKTQARLKMVAVLLRTIVVAAIIKMLLPLIRSKGFYKATWLLFLPLRMVAGLA